jgi:hypothetical protein
MREKLMYIANGQKNQETKVLDHGVVIGTQDDNLPSIPSPIDFPRASQVQLIDIEDTKKLPITD